MNVNLLADKRVWWGSWCETSYFVVQWSFLEIRRVQIRACYIACATLQVRANVRFLNTIKYDRTWMGALGVW